MSDKNPCLNIGIVFGAFDMLHVGHLALLEYACDWCDHLIVGLHVDPSRERDWKNPPVQTIVERFIQLESTRFVHEIIPYETEQDLVDILTLYRPDVRFLGSDYIDKSFTGEKECREIGIEIKYVQRDHRFSSSLSRQMLATKNVKFKELAQTGTHHDTTVGHWDTFFNEGRDANLEDTE